MAINVNTVYKSVLSILNKEQRGFMTPDEFNKIAVEAQMNLLDIAFTNYNKMSNLDTVGRTNMGYADMPAKEKEKIDQFYKTATVSLSGGAGNLPSDIYKIIELSDNKFTNIFELIDKHELPYLLSSPLTAPTADYPVYYKGVTNAGATTIHVQPTTITTSTLQYIKVPSNPRFGFTTNATYGTNVYDEKEFVATGLVTGKTLATTTGYTTLGNSYNDDTYLLDFKGGTFRLTIAGNNLPSSLVVVTPGTGFAVGDTITFPTGLNNEGGTATLSGSSNIVYTVSASDIFENTTEGSTNFELHPSEQPTLVMQILAFAGIIIKDPQITQLASQSIQANSNIKNQ